MRTTYAGKHECLGNGAINVQLGYNKRREEHTISAKIVDCTTKDSEIIPFDPNPEVNEQGIKDFLQRYIYKPYTIGENVVGIEVNFNKDYEAERYSIYQSCLYRSRFGRSIGFILSNGMFKI